MSSADSCTGPPVAAQVSVKAVKPQVVVDELVEAFRFQLVTSLPELLAPLVEELKDLKIQSFVQKGHDKIWRPPPPDPSLSSALPPEQAVKTLSGSSSASAVHLSGALAAPATEAGAAKADETRSAASDTGAEDALEGDQNTRTKLGAAKDDSRPNQMDIGTVFTFPAPTHDGPAMAMEIDTSTPLIDVSSPVREDSLLRASWKRLSGQRVDSSRSLSAREGYQLTPRCDPDEKPMNKRATLRENIEILAQVSTTEKLRIARERMEVGAEEQSWIGKAVTTFLENEESSTAALHYNRFMIAFSILAILVGLLPYVGLIIPLSLEVAIDSVLSLEIFVRAFFCPSMSQFLSNHANVIDSFSAIPLAVISLMSLGFCDVEWGSAFLLSGVPVIRFLRFVRRFPKMQILITAFKDCLEALPVLLYTLAVMGCIFSSAMFLVEPRDNVATLSESAWLVISTISTVGYGDITPCTKCGAALASVLMVVSQLYMAMPFGIIGYNFTIIWEHRTQILLLNGTRDRLAKKGFGAYEIPRLFELFDLDNSKEFDMEEFQLLFTEMDIGFKGEDVAELFKVIDKDQGGTIDEKEFIRIVYPEEYRNMYGKAKKPEKVKDLMDLRQDYD